MKSDVEKISEKREKNCSVCSFRSLKNATLNSWSGLRYMLTERAFLQELCLIPILLIYVLAKNFDPQFLLYLFSSYLLVLFAEIINTAIESVVDRVSFEFHELSKKAKDIASFAIMLALFHLVCVMIFGFFMY